MKEKNTRTQGVEWFYPKTDFIYDKKGNKRKGSPKPFFKSTKCCKDSLKVQAREFMRKYNYKNPTIKELFRFMFKDTDTHFLSLEIGLFDTDCEEKQILKLLIDKGYGDEKYLDWYN